MTRFKRVPLATGVTLNVAVAGNPEKPPVILLHGFPESHRTWREIVPRLQDSFYLLMPDQRGFAGSDLPQEVDDYKTDTLIDDIFALAQAYGLEKFALVGHDWGGAIAWGAALRNDPRLTSLCIINAPHPVIFQASLFDSEEQRHASQYITAFRAPGFEQAVEAMGFEAFFEKTFARHVDLSLIGEAERQQYLADWSQPGAFNAMLNWYRASRLVVPPVGVPVPRTVLRIFPRVKVPCLVIWGMKDAALLPLQLDGLEELVDNLAVVRLSDAGHFAPWEAGDQVARALQHFLTRQAAATAPGK